MLPYLNEITQVRNDGELLRKYALLCAKRHLAKMQPHTACPLFAYRFIFGTVIAYAEDDIVYHPPTGTILFSLDMKDRRIDYLKYKLTKTQTAKTTRYTVYEGKRKLTKDEMNAILLSKKVRVGADFTAKTFM